MNVNTSINGFGIDGGSVFGTSKRAPEHRGGFWSALSAANAEKSGNMLFRDESKVRARLTDDDIASLAQKYNPGDMNRQEYQAFLDDLESMGAITAAEYERMQGYFMAGAGPELRGDLLAKLRNMSGVGTQELAGLNALTGIVQEMDGAINGMSLREQAASGKLWLNLRQYIMENAEEKEKQRQEDEKLELLNLLLDNMTGRNDPRVSAATGLRLGMDADQDAIKSGQLPSELYAYLATLASKSTDELVEETEDERAAIESVDEAAAERLYMDSERRQNLSEDDLMDLARKYDPNNMSREQYDQFLEDMVRMDVAIQSVIERIGYRGLTASGSEEAQIPYVSEVPNAPIRQQSPVDSDIEGWLKNRALWKPGITREAAKRAGLENQYEQITLEEKTWSNIANILADVKRQRYPGVPL